VPALHCLVEHDNGVTGVLRRSCDEFKNLSRRHYPTKEISFVNFLFRRDSKRRCCFRRSCDEFKNLGRRHYPVKEISIVNFLFRRDSKKRCFRLRQGKDQPTVNV